MIEGITYEDVIKDATKTAEAVKAALYYMADLIEGHNEDSEDVAVDVPATIQAATIKFIKPSGGMIAGFMNQFGVLFVQVVPSDPKNMLGHILEQGYHVIPNQYLADWKSVILTAHAEAITQISEAFAELEEEEEGEETSEVIEGQSPDGAAPENEEV
jgi:hypothetical protein